MANGEEVEELDSGYGLVANREEVAGDEEVVGVSGAAWPVAPVVVSSPLACRGYDTPLPWHKAAYRVM